MTKKELFAEVIKKKGWYKGSKMSKYFASKYEARFLNGELSEETIGKILEQLDPAKLIEKNRDNMTKEELFAEVIQERAWYKGTKIKNHNAHAYKIRFFKGTLDEKTLNKVLEQLGYIEPVSKIRDYMTTKELFTEIVQEKGWYKNTDIHRNKAAVYKSLFLKGKLSEGIMSKALKQLGYKDKWEKKKLG